MSLHRPARSGAVRLLAGLLLFGWVAATTAAPLSSAGYHNLGVGEWENRRIGPAILAWERAQWLDPLNTNAAANLRFGRTEAQLEAPRLAWFEVASTWLPANAWPLLASVSFWLALSALVLPPVFRWRRRDRDTARHTNWRCQFRRSQEERSAEAEEEENARSFFFRKPR